MEFRRVEEGTELATTPADAGPGARPVVMPPGAMEDPAMAAIRQRAAAERAAKEDRAARERATITLARHLWMGEYLASGLSMLDWWDALDAGRKRYVEGVLSAILHG